MPNIGGIIKSLQNIMWKAPGVCEFACKLVTQKHSFCAGCTEN